MNTDPPLWPVSVRDSWPVSSVQIRTVVSIDPDTIWGPRKAEHHVRAWTMERHRLERTRQVPCRTMTSSNWRHRTVPSCPYPTQHSPRAAPCIRHPAPSAVPLLVVGLPGGHGGRCAWPRPRSGWCRRTTPTRSAWCSVVAPPSSARAKERPMARACNVHARAQAEGEAWNARVGSRKAAANDGRTFQLRATMYLSA